MNRRKIRLTTYLAVLIALLKSDLPLSEKIKGIPMIRNMNIEIDITGKSTEK